MPTSAALNFAEVLSIVAIGIALVCVWAFAVADLLLRVDMGGGAKAAWLVVVIALPLVGTVVYLMASGRARRAASARSDRNRIDELERLSALRGAGDVTDEEFETLKGDVFRARRSR